MYTIHLIKYHKCAQQSLLLNFKVSKTLAQYISHKTCKKTKRYLTMESNRCFIFFIFGISLLPKIYSDYPALIVSLNDNGQFHLADRIMYTRIQNQTIFTFFKGPGYDIYNACPEENAPLYDGYTLKAQYMATTASAPSSETFVMGLFPGFNCGRQIKPIVFKCIHEGGHELTPKFDVGFLIHDKNGNYNDLLNLYEDFTEIEEYVFINILTIKMDAQLGTIISVNHLIFDQRLPELDSARPSLPEYKKNNEIYGFDVDILYSRENQVKIFRLIFGPGFTTFIQYPDQCLIKVQLAPHEDYQLYTWKLPTLMNINTTAMWKQLHPQWKKVEAFVRDLFQRFRKLSVYTGTAGVLTLADQPIYLFNGDRYPVAKYFWKMVKHEPSRRHGAVTAVLIVMHNDPYTQDQNKICSDMGNFFGWRVSNPDYQTGLTYVCQVHEDITSQLRDDFRERLPFFNVSRN